MRACPQVVASAGAGRESAAAAATATSPAAATGPGTQYERFGDSIDRTLKTAGHAHLAKAVLDQAPSWAATKGVQAKELADELEGLATELACIMPGAGVAWVRVEPVHNRLPKACQTRAAECASSPACLDSRAGGVCVLTGDTGPTPGAAAVPSPQMAKDWMTIGKQGFSSLHAKAPSSWLAWPTWPISRWAAVYPDVAPGCMLAGCLLPGVQASSTLACLLVARLARLLGDCCPPASLPQISTLHLWAVHLCSIGAASWQTWSTGCQRLLCQLWACRVGWF